MAKQVAEDSVGGLVEVRVLMKCDMGRPNDVVTIDIADVEGLQQAGYVDASPAAVEYAKQLKLPKE